MNDRIMMIAKRREIYKNLIKKGLIKEPVSFNIIYSTPSELLHPAQDDIDIALLNKDIDFLLTRISTLEAERNMAIQEIGKWSRKCGLLEAKNERLMLLKEELKCLVRKYLQRRM